MSKSVIHIGLDVHAQTIAVAVAGGTGSTGEVRLHDSISSDLPSVDKLPAELRKAHPEAELRFCYEAGPTGFVLQRHFARKDLVCIVVAPSLIPTRSGDKIKTDRRDAVKLARLFRAGELTGVNIPDAVDEAMRDLCRARTDAVQDQRRQRAQLKAFLPRHGYRYQGKTSWNEKHPSYPRSPTLSHPAHRAVLEDTLTTLIGAQEPIARLEENMESLLTDWQMKPVVQALMGMRGSALAGAMVMVSGLGSAWRFEHPRQLMAYPGLVPAENSSGGKRRQGAYPKPAIASGCPPAALTACGGFGQNRSAPRGFCHARWIMIEAPHHYRPEPGVSPQPGKRQEGLDEDVKACAWKGTRLHKRLKQLLARGRHRNKAQVAAARELTGIVRQIFRLMENRVGAPGQTPGSPTGA